MTKYQYKKFYDNLKTLGVVKDVNSKCTINLQIDLAVIDQPLYIFMYNKDGSIVGEVICCESEEDRFKRTMEEEKAKGLVDFKLSITDDPEIRKNMTVESLCGELNRAMEAPNLKDPDLDKKLEAVSHVKRIGGLKDLPSHFVNDGDTKAMNDAIDYHVATSKRQYEKFKAN